MRLLVDSLIALMLAAILVGLLIHHREQQHRVDRVQDVHQALTHLYDQSAYRVAVGEVAKTSTGFAAFVSPMWFDDQLPINVWTTGKHPWLDIAPDSDGENHPPDPVILRPDQAGFWYNPSRGVFRARVAPQLSNQETLRLYNQLNNTALSALPHDSDETRKPRPLEEVAAALASPGDKDGKDDAPAPRGLNDLDSARGAAAK